MVTYVSDAGGRCRGGSCLRSDRSARCVSGTGHSLSARSSGPSAQAEGPGPTTRGPEREAGELRLWRPRGGCEDRGRSHGLQSSEVQIVFF